MISKKPYFAVMAAMALGSGCMSESDPVNRAPNAMITAPQTIGEAPFEVSFSGAASTDPDGDSLAYQWSYGDGAGATGMTQTHTYTEPGQYVTRLTVNDGFLFSVTTVTITVEEADSSPGNGDGDNGGGDNGGGDNGGGDNDGGDNDGGDNDGGDNDGGDNDGGDNDGGDNDGGDNDGGDNDGGDNDDTNTPPVARLDSSNAVGQGPLTVSLDGSASSDADGDALTYSWDFGDGSDSTDAGSQTSHEYTAEGSYTVTLTVSDGEASSTDTASVIVQGDIADVERVDNPYAGVTGYVNPEWSTLASSVEGGDAVADISTGVWLDNIAAIEGEGGSMGLVDHLNQALAQQAGVITVVVYDLPNRDCAAGASNGELMIANGGMARYKSEFIDPITEILSRSEYQALRIAVILELDSLPNLVTNLDIPACQEADGDDGYREGITYAMNHFAPLDNVYTYIDAAHSGWLGWDSNFNPSIDLISAVIRNTDAGWDSVAGFITNVANYTPTTEPYLPAPRSNFNNGQQVRSQAFYDWNDYFDEKSFAQDFRSGMIIRGGAPSTIGMLIDTSRNGWGGSQRPTHASYSDNLDTFVSESRVDRRQHRGNWCNQASGLGYKPFANPYPGIDAFVWAKPPGESDGVSSPNAAPDPTDPAKQYDSMCDPYAQSREDSSYGTGAMPDAPHAGRWFPGGFRTLIENAYPPVDTPAGSMLQ